MAHTVWVKNTERGNNTVLNECRVPTLRVLSTIYYVRPTVIVLNKILRSDMGMTEEMATIKNMSLSEGTCDFVAADKVVPSLTNSTHTTPGNLRY